MLRTLLACLFLFVAPPLRAEVKIDWKLADGDVFYVERTDTVSQKLRLGEEEFEQRIKHTTLSRFTVSAKEKSDIVVEEHILKVKVDSQAMDAKAPESVAAKLQGAKLTFVLDARKRINRMEGYDKLTGQLGGNTTLRQAATPESVRATAELLFGFQSDDEVGVGDSWNTTTTMPLGPLGKFECKNKCTLKSDDPEEKVEIGIDSNWRFEPAPPEHVKQMKLGRVQMEGRQQEGAAVFDAARGRLASCEIRYLVDGVMSLALPNPVDMKLSQQGEITLRISDKMPK